jgi:hypothetical protein
MPKVEIESAYSSGKYTPPHKRKDGPWESYELEECGRHCEEAEEIRGNPKLMEAIAKHHETKAKEHRKIAHKMKPAMKRGMVSEAALEKAEKRRA